MKKISSIILLAAAISATANANRMNIDLQFDKDGKAAPETTYPYSWNDNWFSQVKYRSLSITDTDTSKILKKSTTTVDEQFKGIDFIGYQQKYSSGFSWALIAGAEIIDIERTEFGYGTVGSGASSQFIGIDNNVEISSKRLLLTSDAGYDAGSYSVRASLMLSPVGALDVNQKTEIDFTSSVEGAADSTNSQGFSYGIKLDSQIKTSLGFDLGLGAEYSYLPLEYDIAQANASLSGFTTTDIEQNETTTRYSLRVILSEQQGMGRPVIGVTQETLSTEIDGTSTDETISYLILGLDKRF